MKALYKISILFVVLAFAMPSLAASRGHENIFYYYPSELGYASVEKNHRKIDILAPQIYTIGFDLKLSEAKSEDILELADDKNIDVMPLVVNSLTNKALMTRILDDEEAREEIIEDLIDEAEDRDFIGWQFDFENLDHLDRDRYVDFVEEAYREFQKEDLILSVAVIPRTTDYDKNSTNQDWSSGYNIGELANVSDFVSVMSYDDPKSKGPVASMDYVRKVLDQTLKDTPREKISLGVPFYCWQYVLGNPKKIANVSYNISSGTQEKYKDNGVGSLYIGGDYQAEFFAFVKLDTGVNYIWCDNVESLKAKQGLIEKENLRGISAWAIGQEDERIWDEL